MANLGSEKVSDTYLNTAINSIKFYYQQVVFNKDSYMINDPVERATRWIEEEQVRQQLSLDLSIAKPKADFVDATFNPSQGSILMRDFAKLIYDKDTLDIGEKKFSYPEAFESYLKMCDSSTQKYVSGKLDELHKELSRERIEKELERLREADRAAIEKVERKKAELKKKKAAEKLAAKN